MAAPYLFFSIGNYVLLNKTLRKDAHSHVM